MMAWACRCTPSVWSVAGHLAVTGGRCCRHHRRAARLHAGRDRLATPATDMATGDGRLMLFAAVLDRFIVHGNERV